MTTDPFQPIKTAQKSTAKAAKAKPDWLAVMPVPADAPKPPDRHPKLGKPSGRWTYRDAQGGTLGYACRFDTPDGKQFRPLALFRPAQDGAGVNRAVQWRWESWPEPRPLYGLDRLASRPEANVILCEGEKAADAAARLLPAYVAIASPNGSKSAEKADWRPLAGRTVVIWPDNDQPGQDYAASAAKLLARAGAASVTQLEAPSKVAEGWDAADAEADGWTIDKAQKLIETASPVKAAPDSASKSDTGETGTNKSEAKQARPRRAPQRDGLMALTQFCDLWHGPDSEAYVTYPVNGHRENWPVRSANFKRWLAARSYEESGMVPGGQALEDTLRVLEARACNEGQMRDPWLRTGGREGKIYIDLCDEKWRVIEVHKNGWHILDRPDVPFIRKSAMKPLPVPEDEYSINELRPFINTASEDDFILSVAWLVAAMRPTGPYPIACIGGEQGSGKSGLTLVLRSVTDPNMSPLRALPKEERDLIVGADNAHVLSFDNVSKVEHWLSDAFCRLSTGGGFSARALHTNRDEIVFQATRPMILNGIPVLTDKPDLGDRAVTIRLQTIPESKRRAEDELKAAWEIARPRVFGALLTAISSGLRNLPNVKLKNMPRMADFAKWVTACESGLGWEAGTFMQAYTANRRNVNESSFEADPVAGAIVTYIKDHRPDGWQGTASEWLDALNLVASESAKRMHLWPKTAQGLGNRLDRIAPMLRAKGLIVDRRHSGVRLIIIMPNASSMSQ